MNIKCLFGFHDWIFNGVTVRSCGSELERIYRCSRCGERKYMACDSTPTPCKYFKFPKCSLTTKENEKCPKMKKK
jgi:hypothetical protein